jgi:peptidoglycan/xylan/chitin deacetylase (PgdA/CDA1 family)
MALTTMSARTRGKRLVRRTLLRSGALRLAGQAVPPYLTVLRYHSVREEPELYANSIGAGIVHSRRAFAEQMELLARRFHPVSLGETLHFLRREKPIPRRAVVVTFDDGYADNFEIVAPVLARFGIQAAFYLTVGSVASGNPPWFCRLRRAFASTQKKVWTDSTDGSVRSLAALKEGEAAYRIAADRCARLAGKAQEQALQAIERDLDVEPLSAREGLMLSWEQARALQQAGHTIGSHTLTHPNLAHVEEAAARQELEESKRILEKEVGVPVVHFSYPHPTLDPHWTEQTVAMTEKAGYQTAVTATAGPVQKRDNPLTVRRISAPGDRHEFLWRLECTFLGRCA